jgi:hypothetical protein
MKKFCILFAIAAFNTLKSFCAEMEDGVMILTDDNFEEELLKNDYLLVEFYAPWW